MNARFRFSAKACLLSAMSGLFVGSGEISAQTNSVPSKDARPVPVATDGAGNAQLPAVRSPSPEARKSEVQRQLEAMYSRDGAVMPPMNPLPAGSVPVKIVPPAAKKTAKKTTTQPSTAPQKAGNVGVQQANGRPDTSAGSAMQQVGDDRRAVYSQPARQSGERAPTPVQQKLQELYQRDGRSMPPMDVSAFQVPSGPVAAPGATAPGMPRVTPAKRNIFQRLFGIHKPSQRQAPAYARPNTMPASQSPYVTSSQPPLVPPATLPVQPAEPKQVPGAAATPPAVAQKAQSEPALLEEGSGAEAEVMDDLRGEEQAAKSPAAAPAAEASPYSGLKLTAPDGEPAVAQQDTDLKVGDAIAAGESKTVSEIPAAPDDSTSRQLQLLAAHSDQKWLKGFCVVTLKNDRQLVEAEATHQTIHQGKTYTFASAEAKAEFDSNPDRYAPANNGNDVVKIAEGQPNVEGSLAHAAWYKGRLYLFSASESREKFIATPKQYATIQTQK